MNNNHIKSKINYSDDSKYEFENLKTGFSIHSEHLRVKENAVFHELTKPSIVFIFLLKGIITFSLNKDYYKISAGTNGRFIIIAIKDTTLFTRYFKKDELVEKTTISGIERWVSPSDLVNNESLIEFPLNEKNQRMARNVMNTNEGSLEKDAKVMSLVYECWNTYGQKLANEAYEQSSTLNINKKILLTKERQRLESEMRNAFDSGAKEGHQIATALNISLRTLQRKVRHCCSCSANEWLRNERMTKAIWALGGGLSIGETAFLCGYSQSSNFIQAFRKHYGVTPGALLQQAQVNK